MDLQDVQWKMWSILLHCTGMVEKIKEMERLIKETVEGWQKMEGKKKVVWGVDKACESGRVQKKMERLYRNRFD